MASYYQGELIVRMAGEFKTCRNLIPLTRLHPLDLQHTTEVQSLIDEIYLLSGIQIILVDRMDDYNICLCNPPGQEYYSFICKGGVYDAISIMLRNVRRSSS